ncbi:MAG TPA: 2OG-Fe(II) oxygenase [Solimonas sp.]|nr:2OG-Fe(II) oxygenase [Solimonas sp.]
MNADLLAGRDAAGLAAQLDAEGVATLPGLLDAATCAGLRALYAQPRHFRSRVVMDRHGYGRGEYQYFADPLPPMVAALRESAYAALAPQANAWAERLGTARRYPPALAEFRAQCHAAGQTRPTPLLLRYGPGDYNNLHQDLYGELSFPLQLIVLLSRPGEDFDGGELVLVEQRPRQQSRPRVVPLQQGDAAVIAVRERPEAGPRGTRRLQLRHGVSTIRRGERYTLGLIFHDAA